MKSILSLCLLGLLPSALGSACPNNCNSHGSCGQSNMCECYRNWFGADCSQRTCTFGRAFIDSPVGDLDGDLKVSPSRSFDPRKNHQVVGIQNVIGGQSEMYDHNYGYARSNQTIAWNEAHFYRECSGKGICNRNTGLCNCFAGYEGEGCARQKCPNQCSGHGQCRNIQDSGLTTYSAWDLQKTQMCKCDPGYEGPDCSLRSCPRGADPVKYAHSVTNSVQGIVFRANTPKNIFDNLYFTITLTDGYGDKWTSRLMTVAYDANGLPTATTAAKLRTLVETVNSSLAYNDGIDTPYVWGVQGSNVYPSAALATNTAGSTVFVDSQKYRLDAGISNGYKSACGVGKKGVCIFIQNENQGVQQPLRVDYWYHGRKGTLKETVVSGQTVGFTSNVTTDTGADIDMVSVVNAQSSRAWLVKDGDVTKTFMATAHTALDVCSNRGLCDYTTGLCNCFAGYTGLSCNEQNSIAYTY